MNSWTSRSQEGKMAGASGYGNGLKWWMVDGGMLTVLPAFWKWRIIMISCALFASCNMFFFCMSRFLVIWCNLHVALRRSSHITFPESFAARDLGQSTKRSHKRYKSPLQTHNSGDFQVHNIVRQHLKSPANPMISYCWEFTPFFFGWLPCSSLTTDRPKVTALGQTPLNSWPPCGSHLLGPRRLKKSFPPWVCQKRVGIWNHENMEIFHYKSSMSSWFSITINQPFEVFH